MYYIFLYINIEKKKKRKNTQSPEDLRKQNIKLLLLLIRNYLDVFNIGMHQSFTKCYIKHRSCMEGGSSSSKNRQKNKTEMMLYSDRRRSIILISPDSPTATLHSHVFFLCVFFSSLFYISCKIGYIWYLGKGVLMFYVSSNTSSCVIMVFVLTQTYTLGFSRES